MGKKLAIKGHSTRGKEVIELLKMMGGHNGSSLFGDNSNCAYFITDSRNIGCKDINYISISYFTLEEFLKKYPFKVGDAIRFPNQMIEEIAAMEWDEDSEDILCTSVSGWKRFLRTHLENPKNNKQKETIMKYKVGNKVRIKSIDWYNENKDNFGRIDCGEWIFTESYTQYCGKVMTIRFMWEDGEYYKMVDSELNWSDEMIEELMEEKTPKFKVNDIVFVKNIGWVRITNSYWDFLANEYIYEAIGFNGEGEYDCISQSNIEDQMLPESENPHTGGNKITLDEYKNNDKEWLFNKLAMLDNITALESIQDIFNHLQKPKYPKTYDE